MYHNSKENSILFSTVKDLLWSLKFFISDNNISRSLKSLFHDGLIRKPDLKQRFTEIILTEQGLLKAQSLIGTLKALVTKDSQSRTRVKVSETVKRRLIEAFSISAYKVLSEEVGSAIRSAYSEHWTQTQLKDNLMGIIESVQEEQLRDTLKGL